MSTPTVLAPSTNHSSTRRRASLWQRIKHPRAASRRTDTTTTKSGRTTKPPPKLPRWVSSRRRTESVNTVMSADSQTSSTQQPDNSTTPDVLSFLQGDCPQALLPKILAYCGPQQTSALSKTNSFWNSVIKQEGTWRILCEELYKWKPGDPEPDSWFDLYRFSPCVPMDYRTIPAALKLALPPVAKSRRSRRAHEDQQASRSIHVWLRPGKYCLKQAVDIQAAEGVTISMSTMELPTNLYRPSHHRNTHHPLWLEEQPLPEQHAGSTSGLKRPLSFRNLWSGCHKQNDPEESETEDMEYWEHAGGGGGAAYMAGEATWLGGCSLLEPPRHATILLRARAANEPVFRVQRGVLHLSGIEIQHNSYGLDIWNGNAAVQIQPLPDPDQTNNNNNDDNDDGQPARVTMWEPRPLAILDRVHVTSKSGRGIVNIDGGTLRTNQCIISDCAATGIYIGGQGSSACIDQTDVLRNGLGKRRGIARGHSGIYLEQGLAVIRASSVSNNTLTGISVVSPDNAQLKLCHSSLIGNGTYQLELPPLGSASRNRMDIATSTNVLAVRGQARLRSGLHYNNNMAPTTSSSSPYVRALEDGEDDVEPTAMVALPRNMRFLMNPLRDMEDDDDDDDINNNDEDEDEEEE